MSEKKVDARGLSCPQPVILAQKAINEGSSDFEIYLNSNVSKENVLRFAAKNKMTAEVKEENGDYIIRIHR
jgi:TusA-related sulfurtransferase